MFRSSSFLFSFFCGGNKGCGWTGRLLFRSGHPVAIWVNIVSCCYMIHLVLFVIVYGFFFNSLTIFCTCLDMLNQNKDSLSYLNRDLLVLKRSACLQRDLAGEVTCPSWNVLHAYNGTWQGQWHVRAETFYRFRAELDRNSDLSVQALQRNTIGAMTYIHSCNWTGHERTRRYRSSTGHERHVDLPEFNTFYKLTMYRTR